MHLMLHSTCFCCCRQNIEDKVFHRQRTVRSPGAPVVFAFHERRNSVSRAPSMKLTMMHMFASTRCLEPKHITFQSHFERPFWLLRERNLPFPPFQATDVFAMGIKVLGAMLVTLTTGLLPLPHESQRGKEAVQALQTTGAVLLGAI